MGNSRTAIVQFAMVLTTLTGLGCETREQAPRAADDPPVSTHEVDPREAPLAEPTPTPTPTPTRSPIARPPMLVVLGVAQDGGVPQAACDCPRCRMAAEHPENRPRVASVALAVDDEQWFLVDATPDLPWQLRDIAALRGDAPGTRTRRPVSGVLLTHGHMGHYVGLAHLGFEAAHVDHIPVYGTPSMLALLRDHAPWSQLVSLEEIELRPLTPGHPLVLGAVRVVPVAVPHRAELTDTVAFRFEGPQRTALYLPDCDPWARWDPEALDALLEGVDVALLDGTFYSGDELPGRDLSAIGHPLIVDTMAWLEERPAPVEARFIHLNHSNPALEPGSAQRRELQARGHAVAARGDAISL